MSRIHAQLGGGGRHARLLCLVAAVAASACSAEAVTFEDPGGDEGDLPQPTLVVEVGVDSADAELAEALGWMEGVPGAEVQILRSGTLEWFTATTDSSGRAVFTDLEPGRYRTQAERLVTPAEASEPETEIRAFGDGRTVKNVGADTARVRLELLADRPGTIVIAEISNSVGRIGAGVSRLAEQSAYYLEVYNQGGGTRYLDGMVLGFTFSTGCVDCFTTCQEAEPLRMNSERLGAPYMLQFPGSGGEHPIGPGELRLVAVSAQDHRDVHPNMPDLRDADFELPPPGVADNPEVPNMVDVGPEAFSLFMFSNVYRPKFLAEPLDVEALPVIYRDERARSHLGVPREKLLDVFLTEFVWPESDLEHPECIPRLHRVYDRYPGFFLSGEDPDRVKSMQRRVLRTGSGGWPILMNTRTSAVDLREIRRTPGELP
jgi:hypothetical protein